jgi:hypothetical protein
MAKKPGSTNPGAGHIRFIAASGRGVSAEETFDRPLVFGYHAIEVVIKLGADFKILGASEHTYAPLAIPGED